MATPNFCSWEAVKQGVADNLHVAASALPREWDGICSAAARRAASLLRSILILKGYTPTQVAAWDDSYTASLQLATFYALTAGSALAGYDAKNIEWMNNEKEMREAQALIIGGAVVAPAANGEIGGVHSGVLDSVDTLVNPDSAADAPKWGMGTDWTW